ncbi:MAG: HD domain-containing protein [Syntrophomonadaceae bacterium]|nr:HD domain-containing protein [Syntrophomonadaceae bacterium]
MISKELLEILFRPASMQRWNDHIRPHVGFTELDKQAHKFIFAYIIAKTEETDRGVSIYWQRLIEGGIFEFLQRAVLTDLKPSVFNRLMANKSQELNDWVIKQVEGCVAGVEGGFLPKLKNYLSNPQYAHAEKRILKASHYLATRWEFEIIRHLNQDIFDLGQTDQHITNEIEEYYDLAGVQKLYLARKTGKFMDKVGQLRFQQRWAQTHRVPQTSVLGHMLVVAIMNYFFSVEIGSGEKRIYNNFMAGLWHDLPEILTRDIVSPVKRSVEGLEELIKEIERSLFMDEILPLLPRNWHQEILYFIADDFSSRIMVDGNIRKVTSEIISKKHDTDTDNPLDGELVRAADQLAAYIEAAMSIAYGLQAPDLVQGKQTIYDKWASTKICQVDFRTYFDYFA